jgi:carboxypeptidase Q
MRSIIALTILLVPSLAAPLSAQPARQAEAQRREQTDSAAVARILDEGMNRSQVMDLLSGLTDVCGPRLTGSPGHKRALSWTTATMKSWGLQDVHLEGWGPFGRGWTITTYSAQFTGTETSPLLSYPKAWSPGTDGTVRGGLLHLDASNDSALQTYAGKLKGKFVLLGDPVPVSAHWTAQATRQSDSTLLALANADAPQGRARRPGGRGRPGYDPNFENRKLEFCLKEGAIALLTPSRGDGGTIFVQGATAIEHPDTPWTRRGRVYSSPAPRMLPQVAVAAEQYNRLVRLLARGENVRMEMNLAVTTTREDSAYNVLAEIPGTDLKDEVVMLGAHLDSWHGGTGATDNGSGVATCMEAMRIIKSLGLKPRRTIRVGLWAAEEQGLLGSRAYVRKHLGERPMLPDTGGTGPGVPGPVQYRPEAEKFSVYFNNDNGTGRIRGVYMQGNESARPVFRAWLAPFKSFGASTLTPSSTGSTDHASFDAIGLPAFQFIQDDVEYFTRTWHSTMDVYERAVEDDLKQASTIMAAFAYNAAMRDELFPRKQRP